MFSELEWHPWNWRVENREEGLQCDLITGHYLEIDVADLVVCSFFLVQSPEGGAVRTESQRPRLPLYRRVLKYSRYFNTTCFAVALFSPSLLLVVVVYDAVPVLVVK